jgi:hypothetical protein
MELDNGFSISVFKNRATRQLEINKVSKKVNCVQRPAHPFYFKTRLSKPLQSRVGIPRHVRTSKMAGAYLKE